MLTLPIPDGGVLTEEGLARAKKDVAFLSDTGNQEDAKVVSDIQAAIGSGANTHYRFGRFESLFATCIGIWRCTYRNWMNANETL